MELSATDLRIGNLVKINNRLLIETEGEIYKVSGFNSRYDILFYNSTGVVSLDHTKTIKTYSQFDEFIEPIPLTEEWMIMLGFEKNGNEFIIRNNDGCFIVEYFDYTKSYHFTGGEGVRFGKGCKYVHQLQNLYHALTGEELIIK